MMARPRGKSAVVVYGMDLYEVIHILKQCAISNSAKSAGVTVDH